MVRVLNQAQRSSSYDGESLGARYRALLGRPLKIAGAPEEGALARLAQRFPWMKAVVLEVSTALALARRLDSSRVILPPLLLHGPPGIGKTRFCVELGAALGRGVLLQPMAALQEGFTISGSSRTYHQPDASLVVRAMYQHRCADPIIVLDELDKAGKSDWNGNAQSALLAWMEPTTAHMALDVFLDTAVDATYIAWIATANDVRGVAKPLLSRFRRIDVNPPGSDYIDIILSGFARALASRFHVDLARVPSVSARTRAALLRTLEAKGDLREVEAQWQHAIARQELHIVEPPGP
jgi:MoxR-like ATPase